MKFVNFVHTFVMNVFKTHYCSHILFWFIFYVSSVESYTLNKACWPIKDDSSEEGPHLCPDFQGQHTTGIYHMGQELVVWLAVGFVGN